MKHLILSLSLVFMSLISIPVQSYAQVILDDDEGDEIVIINEDLFGNGPARDLAPVPVCALLFRLSSCIGVEFLNNMGIVTITLSNQTTGGTSTMQINSSFGEAVIPVSLGSGNYRIDFCSSCGNYYGYFFIL